ncbi:hypothetical protein [uncultured Gemmiger sp.]|uniref:YkvI family membrane protein n=1 Tax=uncultured Gemmiger sp. TaxID=1623490 RepID=UPI0025E12AA1|nr:hypothetical protein [uncultured Gemmiger sp.]
MVQPHRTTVPAAAGAIIACLIGAGFASGQEVLQFFTVYGPVRGALGGLLAAALLGTGCELLLAAGRGGQRDAFACCGPLAGRLLAWAAPALLFGVYVVMLAGAGALVQTGLGLPPLAGRAAMLAATLVTALAGLGRMTRILGRAGPLIVAFVLAAGAGALIQAPGERPWPALPPPPARSWWMSALVYAGYNLYLLAPFLAALGSRLSPGAGRPAAWLGCGVFGGALVLLHLAFCRVPGVLSDTAPAVALVRQLWPWAAALALPVLLAGVYTTAAPLLFSVCRGLPGGRWGIAAVAAVGFACSGLPFGRLVAGLYPLIGWFGLTLAAGAALEWLRAVWGGSPARLTNPGRRATMPPGNPPTNHNKKDDATDDCYADHEPRH